MKNCQRPISMVFAMSLSLVTATHAEPSPIAAGLYVIESQMVLPHLDEMRRISAHETTCIDNADATRFFPVFRQPALIGCALHPERADAVGADYVLTCASANGATGTARLNVKDGHVKGKLMAKMGGKNMTFSQHVEAYREGNCEPEK